MSPPSGLIGGFGATKETPDVETTALLSSVRGEVEKVRRGVWMQYGTICFWFIADKHIGRMSCHL